jgi:hypothetical protein
VIPAPMTVLAMLFLRPQSATRAHAPARAQVSISKLGRQLELGFETAHELRSFLDRDRFAANIPAHLGSRPESHDAARDDVPGELALDADDVRVHSRRTLRFVTDREIAAHRDVAIDDTFDDEIAITVDASTDACRSADDRFSS